MEVGDSKVQSVKVEDDEQAEKPVEVAAEAVEQEKEKKKKKKKKQEKGATKKAKKGATKEGAEEETIKKVRPPPKAKELTEEEKAKAEEDTQRRLRRERRGLVFRCVTGWFVGGLPALCVAIALEVKKQVEGNQKRRLRTHQQVEDDVIYLSQQEVLREFWVDNNLWQRPKRKKRDWFMTRMSERGARKLERERDRELRDKEEAVRLAQFEADETARKARMAEVIRKQRMVAMKKGILPADKVPPSSGVGAGT